MDTKLLSNLKKNADEILNIMERNGIDVSKYRKLSEEQKEKEKRNKAKAKIYRQNYKTSATAFLRRFAYADILAQEKQRNKEDIQTLKDCLTLTNEHTNELQNFLRISDTIKAGKKPYYGNTSPLRLKSLEQQPSIMEKARLSQEERIKKTKEIFIKYYCENWFFILLKIMNPNSRTIEKLTKEQKQ